MSRVKDNLHQGILTEGEGSVQLTSSVRQVVLQKKEYIVSLWKGVDLN